MVSSLARKGHLLVLCVAVATSTAPNQTCSSRNCHADSDGLTFSAEDLQEVDSMKTSLLQSARSAPSSRLKPVAQEALYQGTVGQDEQSLQDRKSHLLAELADIDREVKGLSASPTCEGYKTCGGHYVRSRPCQCTDECEKYGNCCADYVSFCKNGAHSSCASYNVCGGHYVRGHACQCTDQCEVYGNCCEDYVSFCKNRPTPPPTPMPPYGIYTCESNLDFGNVVMNERKGIALDDTTFERCADQIPMYWPNTNEKVLTVRLFKAWGMTEPKFFHGDMHKAWKGLKGFAQASGAKFLVGISVTCHSHNDEKEWAAGREFIRYVGAEHIMGIAIGNEIDLQVGGQNQWCIDNLWKHNGYFDTVVKSVEEFDALPGMQDLPITAVLSMNSMDQYPFKWKVQSFLKNVKDRFGDRFIFSVNVYPQFSGGLAKAGCQGSIDVGTKFTTDSPKGFLPNVVADIRKRLDNAGLASTKIWIGETGWHTSGYCVLCGHACHSREVHANFYKNFLSWDLDAGDGTSKCGDPSERCAQSIRWAKTEGLASHPEWYPGLTTNSTDREFQIHLGSQNSEQARGGCSLPCDAPGAEADRSDGPKADHVFYFTIRDSEVFGHSEQFGLVERCGSKRCKFQK